jgi:hypothetical protein
MEELFVVNWAVSGNMTGETWTELEVVTDEAETADTGTEDAVELRDEVKFV